ncbi:TM2 domain-containing protein [Mycoplasmopsis pullorum]|uniref:TM2 domain-containing protein n=1 Tax=Mycoplasmopsis pullorum TaxID=48003 RepID=A0A1L4FT51_9BACT|nr:TM2 domain-containing protein [Mycoplasmopsis pullorum]APJ38104.1 hypothetical protein BLA55_00115 [Mycoplasmopsis pullorum]APJ38764.1 hypothetical protein BLA55_03835 [Mycoplasmopsis pullorum]APJ38783.1 hypothetical protein BLA55_03950 [Mycoplasmopsis pullorum]
MTVSNKSRVVLVILSFFLGALAIDRFYAGRIGLGIAKLLLGVFTLYIWNFVDFILAVAGRQKDNFGLYIQNW